MIFDTSELSMPLRLKTDLCVVGTGPGGSMVAREAARAGLRVTMLEAGGFWTPADMTQREEEMFPKLFWEAGGRTNSERSVKIHQGKGVGGSSLHNLNLCKRIPPSILSKWVRERGLEFLEVEQWDALYEEVEALLEISTVPASVRNRHNSLLERACGELGWSGGGLQHNRTGCIGSGFCEVGCAYDAKNNALKKVLPEAIERGSQVLTYCQATRLDIEDGRLVGVFAQALKAQSQQPFGEVYIETNAVALCASATGTPAILQRSDIPDPGGETGSSLRVHPAVVVAGDFEDPVRAWQGIPQSYECTEFLDFEESSNEESHRLWIVPAFAHPVGTATMLPGMGDFHGDQMSRYAHLAILTAMLHDETQGSVQPRGDLGVEIDYWPNQADCRELSLGLWACTKLLFAAGARSVLIPNDPTLMIRRGEDYSHLLDFEIRRGALELTAVHPMASVPMGDDPSVAAVSSSGKHHHVEGVWVADASLFPTSIGVPPQLSTYALGLHVGRGIARELTGVQ
jgi:choline dehydrogenase-like flavoprotein